MYVLLQKRNTHAYTGTVCQGWQIIYKHAAHRLVQHTLQVVEMAWTDDSTLAISIALL